MCGVMGEAVAFMRQSRKAGPSGTGDEIQQRGIRAAADRLLRFLSYSKYLSGSSYQREYIR